MSRLSRRLGAVIAGATALAATVVACSDWSAEEAAGGGPPSSDPAPTAGATSDERPRSGQPCPVTAARSAGDVPPILATSDSERWYGEDGLWVSLPRPDVSVDRDDGRYRIKFGTVTLRDGEFTSAYGTPTLRVARLDGRGNASHGYGGYANAGGVEQPMRFWPTGIELSDRGCWQVTSSLRGTTIRFVLRVW